MILNQGPPLSVKIVQLVLAWPACLNRPVSDHALLIDCYEKISAQSYNAKSKPWLHKLIYNKLILSTCWKI